MRIFSKWGGKINRVSRRHAGRAVRGSLMSMFSGKIGGKNDKRGGSIYGTLSNKGKVKF
jgi:hypothetical protein